MKSATKKIHDIVTIERKVPVSERAVLARVNRKLTGIGKIRRFRGDTNGAKRFGRYGRVDDADPGMVTPVDLESFGREIGALNGWEEMVTD